jgi:hypothetical protein
VGSLDGLQLLDPWIPVLGDDTESREDKGKLSQEIKGLNERIRGGENRVSVYSRIVAYLRQRYIYTLPIYV